MYINRDERFETKSIKPNTAVLNKKPHAISVRVDRKRLERLPFLCQAMWELLKEVAFLEDQDLIDKMDRMDLLDSYRKGQLKLSAVQCGKCGRKSNSDRKTCIYCGHPLDVHSQHIFLENPTTF